MTTTTVAPLLVSLDVAAERLGISRAGLYRALERGDLLAVKVGQRRLVPVSELDAYVARLTDTARP